MAQQEHRAAFWEMISQLGANRDSAWLLSGDFNDILENREKVGGPERCEGSFIPFRSFVSQNGLWDVKTLAIPCLRGDNEGPISSDLVWTVPLLTVRGSICYPRAVVIISCLRALTIDRL